MKQTEAAAVALQPPAQLTPVTDRMDGFVFDQLFENRRCRPPVELTELEQSGMEPRAQQPHEIGVDRCPFRMRGNAAEQPATQLDERSRSTRREAQSVEQLLPWRFDHL